MCKERGGELGREAAALTEVAGNISGHFFALARRGFAPALAILAAAVPAAVRFAVRAFSAFARAAFARPPVVDFSPEQVPGKSDLICAVDGTPNGLEKGEQLA